MLARCRFIFCVFSLIALILGVFPSSGYAEVKEIIAEGTYSMGDGETPLVADERCLLAAKRAAIEQAGTYIQSYSQTKNYQLTADEVRVIASGIMQVTVLDKHRTMEGNNLNFWVKIKAEVTTDKIEDMASKVKELTVAEDYKKLQEEYDKSQGEVAALKQQLQQTNNDTDKQRIRSQIADTETVFTANTWFDRGNVSMANRQYNEAIKEYTETIRMNSHMGRAYLRRGQAYLAAGEYQEALEDFEEAANINPQLVQAYIGKGYAYEKIGRRHEAIRAYRTFIEYASPNQQRLVEAARYRIHRMLQRNY